jgi:hypothetical protein
MNKSSFKKVQDPEYIRKFFLNLFLFGRLWPKKEEEEKIKEKRFKINAKQSTYFIFECSTAKKISSEVDEEFICSR